MVVFKRHKFETRGHVDHEPPPCTWDYLDATPDGVNSHNLAFVTCAKGHCCRLVSSVHTVAPDGSVSPSYVCPVDGCSFHTNVRLEGWGLP